MKPFVSPDQDWQIVRAIEEAELRTSGEVRVYISSRLRSDVIASAQSRFVKLGMHKTKERNGVLIYLVPRTRQFAVIGDEGVHAQCGDAFWKQVSAQMSEDLRSGPPIGAIVRAVETVGKLLAEHFPRRPGDVNELPNRVERD
jgi:uncharacterized membrane protein